MTASFAAQFATEVERLLRQEPGVRITDAARIESETRKAGAAIKRLLVRLETKGAGEALLAHLKAREAERDALCASNLQPPPSGWFLSCQRKGNWKRSISRKRLV